MLATVFAALPPALEALLAVVGVFAAVLTIVPALVGFVGLAQHSFYGNEYLKSHGHVTGHGADTPHAHT